MEQETTQGLAGEDQGQAEGGDLPEEGYRYDPAADPYWYPPYDCTLSEFALLSAGIDPHRYVVVLAFIEELDRMEPAVFHSTVLDHSIRGSDRLTFGGRERTACALYARLRGAVMQEEIPTATVYKKAPEPYRRFRFAVLKAFAEAHFPNLLLVGADTHEPPHPSPASLLIEALAARTGDDAMPRLLVVLEAYRQIYEENQSVAEADIVPLLQRLWRERTVETLAETPARMHLAYVLKTVGRTNPGRRRRQSS